MEFIEKRAKELYISNSGLSKPADQFGFGFPFLAYSVIFHHYYIPDELTTLVNSTDKDRKACSIKRGDVFLTRTSETTEELGMSCVALKDYPNATFNGFAKRLRPITDEIVPEYAAYYFRSNYFRAQCMSMASLITRASLNDGMIERLKIRFPKKKPDQIKIGSILMNYDKQIEINNKQIKVLEQMAENLYKEWFVRFRFPGHETVELIDSRLGKLPSSFSVVKMEDVFDYYIGGGWGNDEEDKDFPVEAYVIRGTDFPKVAKGDISTCPLRYHKKSNYEARELQANDIILEVSGGTAEQPVGRTLLVTDDTIERLGGKVICASFCKQIRVNAKIISPIYFYYWMQFLYDTRIIDRFQLQSTGIINFQFEYFLKKGEVMLPSKEIMEQFDNMIQPIQKEIALIAKRNDNLIKQRDLLLPRLMSGKLEV